MALDYDFFLTSGATSLGFNKKITNETPEERATAQFRKEQFDSQQTVGDQSLSGWWTRGQLSFHRGAGVKYYEVLDGEEVLNRFQSSTGIYPWEPGETVLSGALSTVALANVADSVGATWDSVAGVHAIRTDGSLHFASTSASEIINTDSLASYDFDALTTSGSDTYPVKGDGVYALNGAAATYTNFVKNPRFYASGDTTQIQVANADGGASISDVTYHDGYLTYGPVAPHDQNYLRLDLSGLTTGVQYRVLVEVDASSPGPINLYLDSSSANSLGTAPDGGTSNATFTATATSHWIGLVATTVNPHRINRIDVVNSPHVESDGYNPVDSANWSWTGAANNSNSTRSVVANSYFDILWKPVAGRTWAGAWWAKGRLFALDSAGKWHTLSTAGGTADDAATMFWNANLGTTGWSVAESPGAVYIARGTDIYKVTPDGDGSIPTITTPVVAASLPTGETISTIYAYLGRMVICTNQGLRIAFIDTDSGDLIYGPRIVDGDFSDCVRVTALGELAYVVGTPNGAATPSLYAVNLADNEDLEPAWAEVRPVATGGTLFGATATPDGKIMSWDGSGFYRSTTGYVTSGTMLTGFHRLGTLEPKAFQYLRVITEGTVGSVSVDVVLPDGTSTSVGSVAAGNSAEISLAAAVPTPAEYIALRFTLAGDGVGTPTLLGYQLKALPLPKRQRMKRVPLMLFDREQNRVGQEMGNDGSAWTRLQALEALETANAVVGFEDKETGETGSAYIESVEMRRTAPTSRHGDGFGGTIWLTLRVI